MGIPVLKQTTEFRIEKGVELPSHGSDANRKYPFNQMDVGDSFAVPEDRVAGLRTAAFHYGKNHNIKLSIRKINGGFRCWRIA